MNKQSHISRICYFLAALSVSALASCASTPAQPYYASPIKDVGGGMWDYWRQVLPMVGGRFLPPKQGGCAEVEITIDSNGKVWDPKVLRFIGPAGFDSSLQRYLLEFQYRPSARNSDKVPVRATFSLAIASHTQRADKPISDPKANAADAASGQTCLADLQTQGVAPAAPGQQ